MAWSKRVSRAKLAEAVNGYGEQVTEVSQLGLALKRGLEHYSRTPEGALADFRLQRREQVVTGAGNAAGNDHHLRVQH
jgi:hypothetical protein